MIIVLAFGMSTPLSMMVVESRMSASPLMNRVITFSSTPLGICPWPTISRALGTSLRIRSAMVSMVVTRLCKKKTCPPRFSSRWMALRMIFSSNSITVVSIGSRSCGGVSMVLMSRAPVRAMCSVRGIGVAVSVNTSTVCRSILSFSLCSTPKRCSSSMITSPSSLNRTFFWMSLCVPTTMSTEPAASPSMVASACFFDRNRESNSTEIGNSAMRSRKVL